jgi:hypothetical protein
MTEAGKELLWCVGGAFLLFVVGHALYWFFFDTGPGERPDQSTFAGWRDRKAEATSYWEMAEYRDSIEGNRETRETPFRRLLRWWRSKR